LESKEVNGETCPLADKSVVTVGEYEVSGQFPTGKINSGERGETKDREN